MISFSGVFFNDQYQKMNYLSVANSNHLVVALLYGGITEYTINGEACRKRCSAEPLRGGKNWC